MILEQQLERQIIAAVKTDDESVYYSGAWSQTETGDVKGAESSTTGAVVTVTVSPRVMDTYGGGVDEVAADFGVAINCAISADADPTGAQMLTLWQSVSSKVWSWVKNQTSEQTTELTVFDAPTNRVIFSPGGVMSNGGTAPTWVAQAHMWTWSISFTVKGIITE